MKILSAIILFFDGPLPIQVVERAEIVIEIFIKLKSTNFEARTEIGKNL